MTESPIISGSLYSSQLDNKENEMPSGKDIPSLRKHEIEKTDDNKSKLTEKSVNHQKNSKMDTSKQRKGKIDHNNDNAMRVEDEHIDDEARWKNLSFQGVPNSIRKKQNLQHIEDIEDTQAKKKKLHNYSHPKHKHSNSQESNHHGRQTSPRFRSIDSVTSSSKRKPVRQERRRSYDNGLKPGFHVGIGRTFKKLSNIGSFDRANEDFVNETPTIKEDDFEERTKCIASDLLSSLLSATPAALFAGTQFLRDNHGHRRAPILLAMLDVRVKPVVDSDDEETDPQQQTATTTPTAQDNNTRRTSIISSLSNTFRNNHNGRKSVFSDNNKFEICLEYGIDKYRTKWSVVKTFREIKNFYNHLQYVAFQRDTIHGRLTEDKKNKFLLPVFPHKSRSRSQNTESSTNGLSPVRNSLSSMSSASSFEIPEERIFNVEQVHMKHLTDLIEIGDDPQQPLYIRLERYFRLLNLALCLRPEANMLLHFYEFSTIGNLLSYEAGYKGKEGLLITGTTAKSQGWRVQYFRAQEISEMVQRHTPKWFLVRDSYIMYVSDIWSTTPLEVFMLDSKFDMTFSGDDKKKKLKYKTKEDQQKGDALDWDLGNINFISTNLLVTLTNAERKLTMICKSIESQKQWLRSIHQMARNSVWVGPKRFDSFAPIRRDAFAKFLVDGRDYFWALSSALLQAEDVIYIHDWWLSPELYLRRPINANQEFRIDRILKKKAEEGVKVFIVVYRNVGSTVSTDSLWTKHSFIGLHKNIHIIRSPNQWTQSTLFWAHHEKFTVIDNTVGFMGGIDLCYGRYDTPEHALRDDHENLIDQTFPGKDYSNARVCDFFELNEPFKSMYDRNEVPRMPWHDIHMMTVGEPARDIARHFVQRWNYLIRQKRPSRPTPLLLPPIDFTEEELTNSKLFQDIKSRSTCEVQILRSSGAWSLGLKEPEKSIQNAYCKLIEESQHYIYIENQFFVTSSSWDGVVVENHIGDALVDRIIKAHVDGTPWKAFIMIPLMPGFDSPVDEPAASSLRLIIQCQFQSISRGPSSIFERLKKVDINPLEYIHFFSLRKWSTIGPYDKLVTEQLYIHAKILIVDDRSCIIGSANINERSQLGSRDSEVAAVIRDTDIVKTKMNNKDYYAGRFALELRQRLMREHLGCDVDLVEIVERRFGKLSRLATLNYKTLNTLGSDSDEKKLVGSARIELAYREVFKCDFSPHWKKKYMKNKGNSDVLRTFGIIINDKKMPSNKFDEDKVNLLDDIESNNQKSPIPNNPLYQRKKVHSFNYRAGTDNIGLKSNKELSSDPRLLNNKEHEADARGDGPDQMNRVTPQLKDSVTKVLQSWAIKAMSFQKIINKEGNKKDQRHSFLPFEEDIKEFINDSNVPASKKWDMLKRIQYLQYLDYKVEHNGYEISKSRQEKNNEISPDKEWNTESSTNGNIPNNSTPWEEPLDDESVDELMSQLAPPFKLAGKQRDETSKLTSGILSLNFIDPYSLNDPICDAFFEEVWFNTAIRNTLIFRAIFHCQPDNAVQSWSDYKEYDQLRLAFNSKQNDVIEEYMNANDIVKPEKEKIINKPAPTAPSESKREFKLKRKNTIREEEPKKTSGKQQTQGVAMLKSRKNLPSHQLNNLMFGPSDHIYDRSTARKILERVHGHLVIFPTEWLSREIESNNWFYNADRLPPIEVFD